MIKFKSSLLTLALLAPGALPLSASAAANSCHAAFDINTQTPAPKIFEEEGIRWVQPSTNHNQDPAFIPQVARAESKDRARIEWSGIQERILNNAEEFNKTAQRKVDPSNLKASVIVDGHEVVKDIPWTQTKVILPEAESGQIDYYVIFKDETGAVRHQSRWSMREAQAHELQTVATGSYQGRSSGERFGVILPESLKKEGVSEELTKTAVRLFNKKVVWDLTESATPTTRAFVDNAKGGVNVLAAVGGKGKVVKVTIEDRQTKQKIECAPEEISRKVDAAFSTNRFAWDDAIVAESRVEHDPQIAYETLVRYFDIQDRNGGVIPRENRANGKSLWFETSVEYPYAPLANLTFTNPYLFHRIASKLYAFHPSEKNLAMLRRATKSVEDYGRWMEKNRSIRDSKGEIVGFNGSALGSGLDNSRGNVGNANEIAGHQRGFVDFLSQQISMYKAASEWQIEFARKAKTKDEKKDYVAKARAFHEKAQRFTRVLNERYWDEGKKFYFDIVPDGKGDFVQDQRFQAVSGFWPLYAKAVPRKRVDQLVQEHMVPESFGGNAPFPSNSRRIDYWAQVKEDKLHLEYVPRVDQYGNIIDHGYHDNKAIWNPNVSNFSKGFELSGRPDVAFKAMRDHTAGQAQYSTKTVEEAYGTEIIVDKDGSKRFKLVALSHGTHPHREEFAGWGASPATGGKVELVIGLKASARHGIELNMRAPLEIGNTVDAIGTEGVQARGGTIRHLSVRRTGPTTYEITSKSDKPFDFRLTSILDSSGEVTANQTGRTEKLRIPGGGRENKMTVELKSVDWKLQK